MALKSDPDFEGKHTFCLENYMSNFVNSNSSSGKSEMCTLMGYSVKSM